MELRLRGLDEIDRLGLGHRLHLLPIQQDRLIFFEA